MKPPGRFLTAEWNNLVMLNYAVEPGLLERIAPPGTELDAFERRTYLSVVGFEFNQTKVLGFAIPLHRSFEEVNLRFYVRRGSRRGVVFIRELVPKRAIAAVARLAFGENYSREPMRHQVRYRSDTDSYTARYSWGSGDGECSMGIETRGESYIPVEGSLGQFITEHYWGYAKQKDGGCLEYQVEHPRWLVREARMAEFRGDPARYYGPEFAEVLGASPESAFMAEGSAVTVFRGVRIK